MPRIFELHTKRLVLRQWLEEDKNAFAIINSDPEVMKYYPGILTEEESDSFADRLQELITKRGWGFWAVEHKSDKQFIGFVGLHEPTYNLPCTPCVEIGWRLAKEYWGKGYAFEAAKKSLEFAFNGLELNEIYSFTSVTNTRSWSLMERLKMTNTGQNFNHPIVPIDSALSEHFLYKITRLQWQKLYNNRHNMEDLT